MTALFYSFPGFLWLFLSQPVKERDRERKREREQRNEREIKERDEHTIWRANFSFPHPREISPESQGLINRGPSIVSSKPNGLNPKNLQGVILISFPLERFFSPAFFDPFFVFIKIVSDSLFPLEMIQKNP